MTRIFGTLIAVLFLSVGQTASAQGLLNRALASMGNADAQFNLGAAYYFGEGVEQDFVEAVKWYRLAAEQGDALAQFNLGIAYDNGEGVAQDFVEAVKWYRLAAEQGNADAQFLLGYAYKKGEGTIKDLVYSHMWFNIAASLGGISAVEARELIAKEMTPEQIAEAQKLARECVRKAYKNC